MAASSGQRSPFGFEEALKGEDAFKEGRCILGGIRRHSRGINADKQEKSNCALLYRFPTNFNILFLDSWDKEGYL